MNVFQVYVLLAFIGVSSAFYFRHRKDENGQIIWNGLRARWGYNPVSSHNFVSLPRTTYDAINDGFVKISDCDTNANWRGDRYVKDDDFALILLYDVQGFIAGIQTTVPSNLHNSYPTRGPTPLFIEDGDRYVISVYFVDPATICDTGRTDEEYTIQGTGTNLYIQGGLDPEKDSILIPRYERDIAGTQWTLGRCFYSMGVHYWHDLRADSNCDQLFPVFLLYNENQLTGFGWALIADLESYRYEHPSQSVFSLFMRTVPTCLADVGRVSTMHIYLTDSIIRNRC